MASDHHINKILADLYWNLGQIYAKPDSGVQKLLIKTKVARAIRFGSQLHPQMSPIQCRRKIPDKKLLAVNSCNYYYHYLLLEKSA